MQTFSLEKKEEEKLARWLKSHDKKCPYAGKKNKATMGERLTYSFTPTSIGVAISVSCPCGGNCDPTDYESW